MDRMVPVLIAGLVSVSGQNPPATAQPAGTGTNTLGNSATNFVNTGLVLTNGSLQTIGTNLAPVTSILGTNALVRPISLQEAIQMALENNYAVQIARYNPEIAQYNLAGSYGIYEPTLGLRAEHSFNSSPGGLNPQGVQEPSTEVEQDSFAAIPGLSGYLPTGLRYGVTANVNGREFDNGAGNVTEQFNSDAGFSLQQPLLRDFWIDQPRAAIMINKKRLRISEWAFRRQLIQTVADVENAYYDLIQSREAIKVQRTALDYANQLLRENKKRVEVGAMAPLDEKQAEAEVASSVAGLLRAEQQYAVAENVLKNLITHNFAEWTNVVLDPMETLVAVPASPELPESWRRGLTMRPELMELKYDLEAQNINIRYLKNQLWPALDLVGTYGHNGFDTSYGRAIDDLRRGDNPRYSYGVVLSIPLGNISPRNALKANQAAKAQTLLQYKALEQNIMTQIDNAIKLLLSQYQQVEATRQASLFARDALSAEQKKYENGKSTSFLVLQFQRDLIQRRFEELAALADYNRALAGLAFAEGATLTRNNIDLAVE